MITHLTMLTIFINTKKIMHSRKLAVYQSISNNYSDKYFLSLAFAMPS